MVRMREVAPLLANNFQTTLLSFKIFFSIPYESECNSALPHGRFAQSEVYN